MDHGGEVPHRLGHASAGSLDDARACSQRKVSDKRVGQILIAAADAMLSRQLIGALAEGGHVVEAAADGAGALALVDSSTPDLVLVELEPDDQAGLELIERLRRATSMSAIVALTAAGSVESIVEAIKRGADQCLARPIKPRALEVVVNQALDKALLHKSASARAADEPLGRGNFDRIVAAHPLMQQLLAKAFQVAQSRATVLIHGETGTGKELIAAAIHQNSKRKQGPFVRLNCAALSESLLESELFGHERGAFTGAVVRRKGRFEQAHLGTLFLDEVSEIPLSVQVKLLRFLQEREFERVGGDEPLQVDVRVVAATNRDLKAMVEDHTFREDLYYRLNVVRLEVPPLRARPSDVPLLAEYFLQKYAAENEKERASLSSEAREVLAAHPWPGNVRELQNVIEQAVVLCDREAIGVDELPIASELREAEPIRLMVPGVTLAELERFAILKTLEAVGGSPSKAAAILGISRRTIQYRMREWGMAAREGEDEIEAG
jgi:DNA-binding NtrC family response regulator